MWRRVAMNLGDWLFVAVAVAWLHSEVTGGGRVQLGFVSLSNRGTGEVLLKALAVLVTRHILVPRPDIFTRLSAFLRRRLRRTTHAPGGTLWIDRARPLTLAVLVVFATRLAVLGVGWASIVSAELSGDPVRDAPMTRSKTAPIEFLQGRWDAGWYASIAVTGYVWNPDTPSVPQNVAFLPAFPLVVRGTLWATDQIAGVLGTPTALGREPGVRAETLGSLINIVLFGVALFLLGRLAEHDIGRALSNRAIVVAAVAPFSLFFSAAYTEALLLLCMVGAFLALRRGTLLWCVVCGTVAGLTKQTGFLLALPLGMYAFSLWRADSDHSRRAGYIACVLAPVVGAVMYSSYLWWAFGDPLAWIRAQRAWSGSERWMHLADADSIWRYASLHPYEALNLLSVVLVLPWIWRSRKIHPAYLAMGGLAVAVPLIANVIPIARMTVPVFPIYLAVAARVTSRWAFGVLVLSCFTLQLAAAWLFYGWRPLY